MSLGFFAAATAWFKDSSIWKIVFTVLLILIFFDMCFYYINAFVGKATPPYPILRDLLMLTKEIQINPSGAIQGG